MANESTPTTLVGMMETITVATTSILPEYSSLWNAPLFVSTDNAKSVTFPVVDAGIRTAYAAAHNDATDVTLTEITVAAQTAALSDYPVVALVANAALKGGSDITGTVAKAVATKVGNTIDYLIYNTGAGSAAETGGFTSSISSNDGFGTSDLALAVGQLKAAGYSGKFVFIGDWRQLQGEYGLMQDIENVLAPGANDEIIRGSGFLGNVQGVELYGTHMAREYESAETMATGFVFAREAIGFGYADPLVDLEEQSAVNKAGKYVGGSTFCAAKLLDAAGGIKINSRVE
jgi:hypothetical protein